MAKSKSFFDSFSIMTSIENALHSDFRNDSAVQVDPRYVDAIRNYQYESTSKKFEASQEKNRLEQSCFETFLEVNHRIGHFNALIGYNVRSGLSDDTSVGWVLRRAKAICAWVLGSLDSTELMTHTRNSGGVSIGVPFSDTSIEHKFKFPISCTRRASKTFFNCITYDTSLCQYLYSESVKDRNVGCFDYVSASRATTVPKSTTKRRMIAIEPTGNMYLQQSLMAIMYKRLAVAGLDVTTLPRRHTQLAFLGSITGHLSTIDFSSASDCVSIELVNYLFPDDWLASMHNCRVPFMEINSSPVRLNCYATMGNATTFPVETLVFYSLAVASVMLENNRSSHRNSGLNCSSRVPTLEERNSVSVFGDDCILPYKSSSLFIEICECLGFIVNKEKSFFDGKPGFRESCGGDYLHGLCARPVFLRAPTSESRSALEPWLYTMLNLVIKRLISSFGRLKYVYGRETLTLFADLFRKYNFKIRIVPSDYPDDSGLTSPDSARLIKHYDFKVSKLVVNNHGTVRFTYCRFVYRQSLIRSDHLHFSVLLKRHFAYGAPILSPEPFLRFPIRYRGGYIVASAVDPCFG